MSEVLIFLEAVLRQMYRLLGDNDIETVKKLISVMLEALEEVIE